MCFTLLKSLRKKRNIGKMNITRKYITFLVLALPLFSFSQRVSNIHFEQQGKQIHIYYNLEGNDTYTVQVFCSTDNSQDWREPLKYVTGNVAEGQKQGIGKLIIWDVLEEREKLSGNIRFRIEALFEAVPEAEPAPAVSKRALYQGNGTSFCFGGRGNLYLEEPSTDFKEQGTVVVSIWVDREGNVKKAQVRAKGTDILDQNLKKVAVDAAKNSKFESDPTAAELQRGTITYKFVLLK